MLVPARTDATETALRALADPVRLRIVRLLAQEQLCTCHLQQELGAKQTLVSHHLRALREAGIVETSPHGRFTYYRLVSGALDAILEELGLLATAIDGDLPRRPC